MELTPAPFHFSSVQKFSHRRGAHIKKLILWKLIGVPNNIGEGVDPFPDPVRHFGPPGGHFRFCSQCGNADCEQMLPMLKGCFAFIPSPHFSRGHQLYNEPLFVFLSVQKIPCFSVLLSTFPLDGVLESTTRVCSLDFTVGAALQVVSVWSFCC